MRVRNNSVILAAFGVILSTGTAVQAQTPSTYSGAADSWTTAGNWSAGIPTTTSVSASPWNNRLNVASSVAGVSLTYTPDLGTLVLGQGRAFVVGNATGSSTFNITGGTVQASGSSSAGIAPSAEALIGSNVNNSVSVLNVSGGLLNLASSFNFTGGILSVGFGSAITQTAALNISGTGAVRVNQLVFNSNNSNPVSLTASVSIGSGATLSTNLIRLGTNTTAQANTLSTVTFNGGTLIATGTGGSIASTITSLVTTGGATIQVDSDTFTLNRVMSGPGGLTKTGNGTLALVSQTYTGATTIDAGLLRFGTSSSFTASTVIGGAGALDKTGTATSVLTVNLANTYAGPTTITSGAILLNGSGALGTTAAGTTVSTNASLGLGGNVTIPAGETITISGPGLLNVTGLGAVQRGALQGAAGTNNLVQGNVVIGAASGTRIGVQDGASLEISGNITQAAAGSAVTFRSSGTGVVLLSGTNDWSGTTGVFGNTLRLGSSSGLPAASVLSVGTASVGQSTVDLNGFNATVAGLSNSGGLATDAIVRNNGTTDSTLTLNPTATQTFPGLIQDGSTNKISLVKTGSFTQALNGANTYTGPTTISGGQLSVNTSLTSSITVGAAGTLGGEGSTSGAVTFGAGSSLSFNPTSGTFFTAAGVVDTTAGATTKINIRVSTPATSGTGIVVIQGGSLTSNGPSDFNLLSRGSLSVVGNQLLYDYLAGTVVWKGANGTNPSFWDSTTTQNFTLLGSDDLFLTGDNVQFDDTASNFSPAVQAAVTAGTLSFNNSANAYTVSGASVTSLGLTKDGTNTAVLANNHTVNGNVALNAGTLQLGNGGTTGTLVATGGINTGSGTTLAIDFGANAGTVSLTGGITGDGSIVKSGAGRTQITTASVANGGPTTINDGTLAISFRTAGVVQTYGGDIGGNGSFEKTGSGVLTLDRANSYLGLTSVTGGYLRIANAASLASTSGVIVTGSSSLALTDGMIINKPITVSGTGATVTASGVGLAAVQRGALQGATGSSEWQGTVTIAAEGTRIGIQDGAQLTLSGQITDGANNFRVLFRTSATGGLLLTNPNNDWSGGTDVLGMGVKLGVNNAISPLGDLRIGSGFIGASVLDLNGFNQSGTALWEFGGEPTNVVTNTAAGHSVLTITDGSRPAFSSSTSSYSSSISGNISLVKTGAGTQSFTGTATLAYSGNTTVTGGLLEVNTPLRPVTGSLVVTGPGAVSLGAATSTSAATGYVVAGEFASISATASGAISMPVVARTENKISVLVTSALSVDASSSLDLGNNDLIVHNGDEAAIRALFNGGQLKATGASPAAAPYTTLAIFTNIADVGVPYFSSYDGIAGLTTTDVIVKFTYLGDTNLDGVLDGADVASVLEGYSTGQSGWAFGDVDNSGGPVTQSDVAAFLTAYESFLLNPISLGNGQGGSTSGGAVPEPSALGLLLATLPLISRRRR